MKKTIALFATVSLLSVSTLAFAETGAGTMVKLGIKRMDMSSSTKEINDEKRMGMSSSTKPMRHEKKIHTEVKPKSEMHVATTTEMHKVITPKHEVKNPEVKMIKKEGGKKMGHSTTTAAHQ